MRSATDTEIVIIDEASQVLVAQALPGHSGA